MSKSFFPRRNASWPRIYAYEDTNPQYKGLLKVGYTTRTVKERLAEIYPVKTPGKPPYRIVLDESAMRGDGSSFTDHEVHAMLRINGIRQIEGEWFRCSASEVRSAIIAVRTGEYTEENWSLNFRMRPEQLEAVERTAAYYKS